MKKTMVFIRLLGHIIVVLLLATAVGVIGLTAYNEGYTNGEEDGSLLAAQYVAQKCYKGGDLVLFGKTYYCGEIKEI